ncbi:MAG: HEPN domain-containing protein [Euryarchaeota archaeon]|nr:HEPN domain-containing protein [Euryarchaeota archaeon]
MKDELKNEIIEDLDRAKNTFASAKRNFDEEDIFTASNRLFVACENAVYACMKLKFGGTTISRKRILMKIGSISPDMMELYERSYDLRVQADYGRKSRIVELNKERVGEMIRKVERLIADIEKELKNLELSKFFAKHSSSARVPQPPARPNDPSQGRA